MSSRTLFQFFSSHNFPDLLMLINQDQIPCHALFDVQAEARIGLNLHAGPLLVVFVEVFSLWILRGGFWHIHVVSTKHM
jgi:hypothetical protein